MGVPVSTPTTGPFPIPNVVDDVTGELLNVLGYSSANGGTWDAEPASSAELNLEGRGLEFDSQFADIYAQRVADGLSTSAVRDGLIFEPSTAAIKGSAIDLTQTPIVKAFGDWKLAHDAQIDIRWFGAKLDGVTDDWPAVKSAFEYAKFIGGGIVTAPTGVKMAVDVSANTNFIVPSNGTSLDMQGSELVLLTKVGRSLFMFDEEVDGFACKNITINDPNDNFNNRNLIEINYPAGVVKNVVMDNVNWLGDNTVIEYTAALIRLRTEYDGLTVINCDTYQSGYILRMLPLAGVSLVGKNVRFSGNSSELCSRTMALFSGTITGNFSVTRNKFDKFQENVVPKFPITFDTDDSAYHNPQILYNHYHGRLGLVADVGVANGAIADACSCRAFVGGLVMGNVIRDANEFCITVVAGSIDVVVCNNDIERGNSVGIAIGASVNDPVSGCIVYGNLIKETGRNASGHLTDDFDGAGVRVFKADRTSVYVNTITGCRAGVAYRESTNSLAGINLITGSEFIDTYIAPDASLNPESPILPSSELPYTANLNGDGANIIDGGTVPDILGTEDQLTVKATVILNATRAGETHVIGAASSRVRLTVNADGTMFMRLTTEGGIEDHTTTAAIPTGTTTCTVRMVFDGSSLMGSYSLDPVMSPSEVINWVDLDGSTFAATTFASNFAGGLRPSIGSPNGVTSTDITEPFRVLGVSAEIDTKLIWNFEPRMLKVVNDGAYTDVFGTQWDAVGSAPVSSAMVIS